MKKKLPGSDMVVNTFYPSTQEAVEVSRSLEFLASLVYTVLKTSNNLSVAQGTYEQSKISLARQFFLEKGSPSPTESSKHTWLRWSLFSVPYIVGLSHPLEGV